MIAFNFKNYDDFKCLFGLENHGNGVKSRKNKILMEHLKNPALIRYCRQHDDRSLLHIRSMAELKQTVISAIQMSGQKDARLQNKVELIGKTYWSGQYRTDSMKGLCEDYDNKAVRYVNTKTERVFKMRAGKFFTAIIRETELGRILSQQVVNWLCEEFCQDWQTYAYGKAPEFELHVDNNFKLIYDEDACRDFNGCSCMVGRYRHSFYEDAVEAKAAYLLDRDGYVLSRAIIFTNVTDQDGKKWRLLERQYSKESNEVLKRLLVDMLIRNGHIDGYKQIGAGCSESRAFVANDGTSLAAMKFSIKCELGTYDTLSYQDSFKFYDYTNNIAYNYIDAPHSYDLDTTDANLEGEDEQELEYDEYHDYDCPETIMCYYHGREIDVDVDNLEDFVWVERENEYHHLDDVEKCLSCGEWLVKVDAAYNAAAEAYFCDDKCETEYIKENFYYSDFDDDYYHNKEDITMINVWNDEEQTYRVITISKLSLQQLINSRKAFGANQTWFILDNAA